MQKNPSQHIFDLHLFHQVHLGGVSAALGPLMQLEPSGEAPTLAKACGLKAWCWIRDFCLGDRKKTIPSTDRGLRTTSFPLWGKVLFEMGSAEPTLLLNARAVTCFEVRPS